MAAGKMTEAELQRLRELHAKGKSRNDIAKALGRSGSTISKTAARLGLSFERGPEVQAATKAKVADAKARRAQLQLDLLAKAAELLDRIDKPALAFNFGGKENTYAEREISEPTFTDKHKIILGVSTAVTASIKIDEHDKADDTHSAIDAWLAHISGDTQ